ncbi:MAG: response regulator [Gammaproteobacteria bacterium]|nr:response regulator [Gammaproteobacteria bacterium]MDH5629792.1 response regulator [Gammaproteobacteria bacterium]
MNYLVADDNDVNLQIACAQLRALGCPQSSIKTAKNGVEATKICESEAVDLVFMDIDMPELDGVEATRKILNKIPNHPLIVALTSNTSDEEAKTYFSAGMKMVLHKPARRIDFINALHLINGEG